VTKGNAADASHVKNATKGNDSGEQRWLDNMAKVGNARGLKNYIQEIRGCATKEAEAQRVHKELGKIRKKYTSSKTLSTYDKKKYLWKLMYTKMLGYDVEFGHKQAMDMMAASTYAEKQVGYVVCGLFLSENDALLRLVMNSVRTDLLSRNEAFQCLALEFTANVGGAEFAQLLAADVLSVVAHGATRPLVRKKAAFCLLRLLRKSSDESMLVADDWGQRLATFLEENDIGVLLGLTSLLIGIVSKNYRGYEPCVPRLVDILERLRERDVPQHYMYYGIPTPWLQVKVLRALQYFPAPEDPAVLKTLKAAIRNILSGNDPVKNPNKNNAVHAIVFEAAATAVSIDDEELMVLVVGLMVRFLAVRDANLRYLALENLGRLSQPRQIALAIAKHRKTIIACMTDPDSSIARGALNLLFTTANKDTGSEIVDELLLLIEQTEDPLREDLVLKAAILAERFPASPSWYVDTMLRLILCMGEAPSDEIWHSVLHLVSSREELHDSAVKKTMSLLEEGVVNEAFLQAAAYILGEYGAMDAQVQFMALHRHYHGSPATVRAMMLNCYEKMRTRVADNAALAKTIDAIMESEQLSIDPDVQQRAIEYAALASNPELAATTLRKLPPWQVKNSVLLRKLVIGNDLDSQESAEFQPGWLDDQIEGPEWGQDPDASVELAVPEGATNAVATEEPENPGAQTAPVADLMDLLSFGDDDESAAPATIVAPAGASILAVDELSSLADAPLPPGDQKYQEPQIARVTENPLFVGDNEVAPPRPNAVSSTAPLRPIASWRVSLYGSEAGVLFEDGNLQVGVRMHGDAPSATLHLDFFVGNKTTGDIELQAFVPLQINPDQFDVSLADHPRTILPGQQIQIASKWTCLMPYSGLPELQLEYSTADGDAQARAAHVLALPVTVNKFAKPAAIPAEIFLKRWNQVPGPPFKLSRSLRGDVRDKQAVESSLVSFGLQPVVVPALGPHVVTAAAIFHCTNGKLKQVPCMASVTVDGTSSSVEVTTADGDVSYALLTALVAFYEAIL
jgi:AP-2 complex subunit alpha